jgi:hypothetical protein
MMDFEEWLHNMGGVQDSLCFTSADTPVHSKQRHDAWVVIAERHGSQAEEW